MVTAFLIFFALVLEYVYDPISNMKNTAVIDNSFLKFKNYLKNYNLEKSYIYLSFPIVIFLIFSILDYLLTNLMHPLFSFLLSLAVLVYCLKPNEFNLKLEHLKFTIESKVDLDSSNRFKYILYSDKNDQLDSIINNIFYSSIRNIFSVTFTFLLLGPAGALAYIILDNFIYSEHIKVDQKSKKVLRLLVSIIEYIPVRVCAFTFAVVANFEQCLNQWRVTKSAKDIYNTNINLINSIGFASFEKIKDENKNIDLEKIIYAQSMISRSLLAWLSIIGFLVITGVFV
ncbi:MAG: regulatory signaling modulator protein AmpE [Gammaproteobacteria bacterium]|tara:strand:+ start:189 stop:1046 length:858 start_codon:yes stop_codon:yes gene_type:complete